MENEFCEKFRDTIPQEPVNCITNLVYIGVAYYCYQYAVDNNIYHKLEVKVLILATVLLGLMSGLMHAYKTKLTQTLDIVSMFILLTTMCLIMLGQAGDIQHRLVILTSLFTIILWTNFEHKHTLIGIPIACVVILGILNYKKFNAEALKKGVIYLGIAFVIWFFSRTGQVLCDPDSYIQGHGMWHILTGISIWYVFLFLFS
jgi:hypothetical protein